jgi:bacteriocin biosynthesis cyclodehydratase domain-containing protein
VRPLLTPAVRRLWRDHETLQLGRPPGRAVVLAGVDAAARDVLGLLDGTRDRAGLLAAAAAAGCPPARTEQVLTLLGGAGLLDDAAADRSVLAALPRAERDRLAADLGALRLVRGDDGLDALRRRRAARVLVEGAGRVGAPVAALLAAAGIGSVAVVDDGLTRPEDCGVGGLGLAAVGRTRQDATRDLLTALTSPGVSPGPPHAVLPDLVVLTPPAGQPIPEPPRLLPHLLAEVRGDVGVVGPLVTPGASACLRCLDLTRTDADPGWPALAVQLGTPSRAVAPCDSALALAVAAQTAMQALALLDGESLPSAVGGTLELTLPDWRWRRRSWQLHPDCDCGWRTSA